MKVLFLFSALLSVAWAQSTTTGAISGTVSDPSGAVVAGVKVTATSEALIGGSTTTTSETGSYRFPSLPPGVYNLRFEMPGFATVLREGIKVSVSVAESIDIALAAASQQQTVVVTGEAPLVDTLNTNVQNTVTTQQLKDIPNARDMWSLIAVQPGLAVTRFDVGGSTMGTQTTYSAYGLIGQNRVNIDGVNTTEGTGSAGFYFDYGAFAEFQLGTGANDASMPTPGVQVNAVLKTGSNEFHGTFYADYENSSWQGTNISKTQLNEGAGVGTRIDHYHDLNGDLGGRIKRDRAWFYVSLRGQDAGNTVTGFPANDPSHPIVFRTLLENITYKISTQLTPNHRLSTYLQWGRKFQPERNAASNYYADAIYKQNSFSWSGNLTWDWTVSPKMFITSRFSTFGYDWPNQPYPNAQGVIDFRRQELQTGNLAGGYDPYRYNRRRYQGEVTGSYYLDRFLGVAHNLKFGWVSEREYLDYEQYGVKNNTLLIYNSAAGSPDFTTPYQVSLTNEPALSQDYLWHHGLYLQDQIKVNRKITINAGVRWDYYHAYEPTEKIRNDVPYRDFFYAGAPVQTSAGPYSIPALYPNYTIPGHDVVTFPHAFAPRLGLAYDLRGDGKTVVKLSWGRFYNNPATALGQDVNPIQKASYTFQWNDLNHDGLFQPNELGPFVSSTGGANFTVAKNFRDPVTDDAEGIVERQITDTLSVRGGFVYKAVHHDWQLFEVGRPGSLFTQLEYFCDPGPTGLNTCANGQGYLPFYDIPAGTTVPASRGEYQTPDANFRDYKNIEFTVNKRLSHRWTAVGNFYYTWENTLINTGISTALNLPPFEFGYVNGIPTNPNEAVNNRAHFTDYAAKVFATYNGWWGLNFTPSWRFQSGQPQARIDQVTKVALTQGGATFSPRVGTFNYVAEPWGTYRQDNVSIFDARVEKMFRVKERYELSGMLDAFNIFNSNADQNQDDITGRRTVVVNGQSVNYQRFLRPTTIIGPRVFRVGFRFRF
ncbi:MAG: TonB-dependent receptor [Acidobacteriaceae bacterium]|nr:TonB-dependent receptor [Acidobacteriaceae bacterium]